MTARRCPVCEGRPPCPPDEAAWHRVYAALMHAQDRVRELEERLPFQFPKVEDVQTDAEVL